MDQVGEEADTHEALMSGRIRVETPYDACSIYFSGSIVGTTLNVEGLNFGGTIAPGLSLFDPHALLPATTITAQLSGVPGGIGTYQLSAASSFVQRSRFSVK